MDERTPNEFPVAEVASGRLTLAEGALPVCLNRDWDAPLPDVRGALVMLHGRLRDAAVYMRTALAAIGDRPDWLVVVPQFLAAIDVQAHALPAATLRWDLTGWMGGDAAVDPAPLSAFAAVDTVLAQIRLACPNLRRLMLAGHSGGGQVVQRYALLGADVPGLAYIVANPSSYAWLTPDRPAPTEGCARFDAWKYGLSDLPAYAGGLDRATLARRYAARDVTYLLGGQDTDPAHPALDRSSAAACQGPHRRARGEAFYAQLRQAFPDSRHRLHIVPGVGHDGHGIFTSAEGAAALFG